MLTVLEKTGKTIEEALQEALTELSLSQDRVDYEVIDEPSKGFLGIIGTRPAKIRVTVKKLDPLTIAKTFLQDIFNSMKITVALEQSTVTDGYKFNFKGENLGILIGKHGQTLDALQYLTNLAVNRDPAENKIRIFLDVEDYRKRREETLYRLAMRLAERVRRTGEKIVLEPMSRHERKIIHTALQDDRRVFTYSDGEEPYRKVVVALKR